MILFILFENLTTISLLDLLIITFLCLSHITLYIFFKFSYYKIQSKYFYYKVKKKITFFHYFVSFILKPFHYKLTGLTYDNFSFFITHYSLYFLYIYHNLKAKHHPHNVKHKITFFNKFL